MAGGRTDRGFTLVEALIVMFFLGMTLVLAMGTWRSHAELNELLGAASATRSGLARARMLGVFRRQVVSVRVDDGGDLVIRDASGVEVDRVPTGRGGPFGLDSLRLRPATLRFNPRGQAAPGSVYLYRGRRGVRLVSNFVGRVREERLTLP